MFPLFGKKNHIFGQENISPKNSEIYQAIQISLHAVQSDLATLAATQHGADEVFCSGYCCVPLFHLKISFFLSNSSPRYHNIRALRSTLLIFSAIASFSLINTVSIAFRLFNDIGFYKSSNAKFRPTSLAITTVYTPCLSGNDMGEWVRVPPPKACKLYVCRGSRDVF